MARISAMHKKWIKEREYRKEYDALKGEFRLAKAVIEARNRVDLITGSRYRFTSSESR